MVVATLKASFMKLTAGRAIAGGSLFRPLTQISSRRIIQLFNDLFRTPAPVFPSLQSAAVPRHVRVAHVVSPCRPVSVLRAQLARLDEMQDQCAKRPHGGSEEQGKKSKRRKGKPMTPETEIRLAIQMAARDGSTDSAFAAYDRARELGVKLPLDSYASMLFLCSGGDEWETLLQGQGATPPATTASFRVTPELMVRGRSLLDDMATAGIPPNEICFTAVARMTALSGDPAEALDVAKQVAGKGLAVRVRCFTPSLVAFAERGDAAGAFAVDAAMRGAGLELGEPEFSRLLQAAAAGGVGWDAAEDVLRRIALELTALQPTTIASARLLFESDKMPKAWKVEQCTVADDGECAAAGARLAAVDLTDAEYAEFKAAVAELATKQERQPNDFKKFVAWLEEHGPHGAVVDAANVAFFGQNFDSGGFNFAQVEEVVGRLRQVRPDLRPLVMLHVNRTTKGPALAPNAAAFLNRMRAENSFYATPVGSNDDWYWMYAAVAAGPKGVLVTRDEMRDHLFQMLAPRFFGKWKQRHQVRYSFNGKPSSLEFQYPAPFTTCVQKLTTGAWMLPCVDGSWTAALPIDRAV